MYRKNAWAQYAAEERARLNAFSDAYRGFLDNAKTEREAAAEAERICRSSGFRNLDALIKTGETLVPGDRVVFDLSAKGAKGIALVAETDAASAQQPVEGALYYTLTIAKSCSSPDGETRQSRAVLLPEIHGTSVTLNPDGNSWRADGGDWEETDGVGINLADLPDLSAPPTREAMRERARAVLAGILGEE